MMYIPLRMNGYNQACVGTGWLDMIGKEIRMAILFCTMDYLKPVIINHSWDTSIQIGYGV